MMTYTIYNAQSGEILHNFSCTDQATADLNLSGIDVISGTYSSQTHYIDNANAVAKDPQPSENHVFDYTTKTWQLDLNKASKFARQQRDQLLSAVDRVNPVWYASLTADQQQALVAYRQHLLDVPQQAGFPTAIEWPAKPTWLS